MALLDPVLVYFLSLVILWSLFSLGLNLQWGYAGLFNIGVAGFLAMGTYFLIFLSSEGFPRTSYYPGHWGLGLPLPIGMLLAALATGVVGALIALPALRLRTDYLAIVTIGFAEIFRIFLTSEQEITGGTFGVGAIGPLPRPFSEFASADQQLAMMLLFLASLLAVFVVLQYLSRSPWGRVLRAIRDDEDAARSLGKDVTRYKIQAFFVGCVVFGFAGGLYALFLPFVDPGSFPPLVTFLVASIVVIGGIGNHKGALVGGLLVVGFFQGSLYGKDYLPVEFQEKVDFIRFIVIGLLLVVFTLHRPEGIVREERIVSKQAI